MIVKKNLIKEFEPNSIAPAEYGTIVVPLNFNKLNIRLIKKIEKRCPGITKDFNQRITLGNDVTSLTGWWIYNNTTFRGNARRLLFINTRYNNTTNLSRFINQISDLFSYDANFSIMLCPKSFDGIIRGTSLQRMQVIESLLLGFRNLKIYYL